MATSNEQSVDALNELLRGEISAVETYRQAMVKLNESGNRVQIQDCHLSHEQRVAKLRDQVRRAGGTPSEGSGAWGALAKLIEGGATVFGDKAAVAALEEGEDHGLKLYRDNIHKLDLAARQLVESELLPAQEQTHRAMSTLKKTMA